ncbi:hypothetical protein GIB67_042549 [Kingdonia uniflora]|uniref:Uncharacterized protein n=1 Tax=Kingdonia uniflora TaxID=39325 RepID=A0A7J7M1A1_9MAGN|nr:hypothetical protein GIB67_042549 [Kingdonia uniflora]
MEDQDDCRYYTMKFKGKIVGVKVNAINTTGLVMHLLVETYKRWFSKDQGRLTWLLFERFSVSTIEPEAVNVVFGVATAVELII